MMQARLQRLKSPGQHNLDLANGPEARRLAATQERLGGKERGDSNEIHVALAEQC